MEKKKRRREGKVFFLWIQGRKFTTADGGARGAGALVSTVPKQKTKKTKKRNCLRPGLWP